MAEHIFLYCGIGFLAQLVFCFLNQKIWVRNTPLLVILGCMVGSMLNFFFTGEVYSLLYYMGWGAVLLSAGSAWVIFALVRIFKTKELR